MLQTIRDNSQGIIAKIIIGFIIGIFALFGAESIVGGFFGSNKAATVNGEDITEQELAVSIQNLMASIGANFQDFDEELLREIALSQLIEDRILLQAARGAGMIISDRSLDREIVNMPQFQLGGVFDNDLARRTMAAQGFTPQSYRAALAERMMMGQLANAYAATAFITPSDLASVAQLQTQTRDFRFVSVPLGSRTLGEAIDAAEILAYYENNPAEFTSQEQVSIQYVVLDKNLIFDEVVVDESRVRAQYEAERALAVAAVERRAAHILFDVSSAGEAEALSLAAEIKARIDAGEDFGDLAREFSADTASATEDGDIGYTDGTVFPQSMEAALIGLEVGQVSGPIVSEFGVHLMKLTEYETQDFALFEDAAERIERALKQAEVDRLYFSRLEALANLAFETFDLLSISDELGLDIVTSEFFGRLGGTGIVTGNPVVVTAAFSDDVLTQDLNSDVIELSDSRAVVVHLNEHRPATLQPLEQVRAEVAVTLRTQKERAKARELGEIILARLERDEDVSDLLSGEQLNWSERVGVQRGQFDLNTEIVQNVFAMPAPDGAAPVRRGFALTNGAYVVVELQAVNPGDATLLADSEREQLAAAMLEGRGRAIFDALLSDLQNKARIR
jgi:peptidyl-prolyl cis-trans isomerase D